MSFSSEVKESLSKISNLADKSIISYELIGYLISNNIVFSGNKIKYSTVNEYNINRFSKLISNLGIINFDIRLKGNKYIITFPKIENMPQICYENKNIRITEEFKDSILAKQSFDNDEGLIIKSLIRGVFLGSGSVNNPENKYHLEMIFSTKENAAIIKEILDNLDIRTKDLERKKRIFFIYKRG